MSIRQTLPAILRGEDAADLSPDSRARLETLSQEAEDEGLLPFLRDECAARLRQPGASLGVEYLLARACARLGETERAMQTLLSLGDRLARDQAWEPLAAAADRALELEPTAAGAWLLVRAHEGLAEDPARLDALWRAWEILPDDLELGLLLAVRLGDAGRHEERRALLAALAPRFAAEGRTAGLEEATLEFVEHDDHEGLLRVIEVLPGVVVQGFVPEARQLVELAIRPLAAAGRAGEAEGALREVARHAGGAGPGAAESFRAALLETLRQGSGRALPDPAAVLGASGLEDALVPLLGALERFDAISALPPGRAVLHGSFGAGRIRSDDAENVIIDFPRSPGHRMPYAAARRSLTPLAEDDLRLLRLTDAGELERLRHDQPGEILVRALRAMGGEADAKDLKLFFVGNRLVPAGEWAGTLRALKAAGESDPRIDHARAFEGRYRLAPEGSGPGDEEADVPLPAIEPRKSVRANLATMRRFLTQHPAAEPALARRFGRYLERAMVDEAGDVVDRARAALLVARWSPDGERESLAVLRSLWKQGLAISDLAGEEEQVALFQASCRAGVEGEAILSGLDSRFSAVREEAAQARDRLDPAGREALRRALLERAARLPQAATRLLEEELGRREPPVDPWHMLAAAWALLEDRPKPSVARKALGWIEAGGPFDRLLAGHPCPEDLRLRLTVLLRQWRSSDRYLFPALEIAERLGLSEMVAAVREAREQRTAKMFAQVGRLADADVPVMTRATWERLKRELDRLEKELRTTIPDTIRRARELGDLRENAEYQSAKLKQANVSKQVSALQLRLARARFVEEAELQDGVAGLGTEVVLESERDLITYWILGEGEQHHGEHVISFQSPVGRILSGKTIGEEVELEGRAYRIVSIEPRLPTAEGHA